MCNHHRKLRAWSVLGAALLLESLAFGAPPPEQASPAAPVDAGTERQVTIQEARAAFVLGRDLMSRSEWSAASEQFAVALGAKETPGLRYYLGYCQEQDGHLVEALANYRRSDALIKITPAADVESLLPGALDRVRAVLPQLVLRGVPPEAQVILDGEVRSGTGPFDVNPGTHQLQVTCPGHVAHTAQVIAQEKLTTVVEVALARESRSAKGESGPSADEEARQEESVSPSWQAAVFWTSAGVFTLGVGTAVAGGIVLGSANKHIDQYASEVSDLSGDDDSACFDPVGNLAGACADLDKAHQQQNLGRGLLIGGLAGAGVGLVGAVVSHFFWPEGGTRVHAELGPKGAASLGVLGRF